MNFKDLSKEQKEDLHDKATVLAIMPIHISQMFDEDSHRLPNYYGEIDKVGLKREV